MQRAFWYLFTLEPWNYTRTMILPPCLLHSLLWLPDLNPLPALSWIKQECSSMSSLKGDLSVLHLLWWDDVGEDMSTGTSRESDSCEVSEPCWRSSLPSLQSSVEMSLTLSQSEPAEQPTPSPEPEISPTLHMTSPLNPQLLLQFWWGCEQGAHENQTLLSLWLRKLFQFLMKKLSSQLQDRMT